MSERTEDNFNLHTYTSMYTHTSAHTQINCTESTRTRTNVFSRGGKHVNYMAVLVYLTQIVHFNVPVVTNCTELQFILQVDYQIVASRGSSSENKMHLT